MSTHCNHCGSFLPDANSGGVCPACLIALAQQPMEDLGDRFQPATVEELRGRVPGIELQSLIGHGGMGAVYRGHQVDLDRAVAVKVIPTKFARDPIFVERFRREAQTLAKLDHPNIVRVFGSGVTDDLGYIVMELVDGVTLREAMQARAVDPSSAIRIIKHICDGLAYAHDHGVIHRDIKPENVLLAHGGQVKLVDFGLAKIIDGDAPPSLLTATNARIGTLRYMAPEQLDGLEVDHRADVYSLGVVFYELLTGQIPMGQFAMPSQKVGTDPRIDQVIRKTLSREPVDRYQHISEMEQHLETIAKQKHARRKSGARRHLSSRAGREWKSKTTCLGWPVVHIAFGHDEVTGEKLVARGLIAIGDVAIGGIASGGVSCGIVSLGGVAFGVNAIGGVAIALQSAVGGVAIGTIALGGSAIGLLASGGAAAGFLAYGGGAIGRYAFGGGAVGKFAAGGGVPKDAAIANQPVGLFETDWVLLSLMDPWTPWLAGLAMLVIWIGPTLLILALAAITTWTLPTPEGVHSSKMPTDLRRQLTSNLIAVVMLSFLLPPLLATIQTYTLQKLVSRAFDHAFRIQLNEFDRQQRVLMELRKGERSKPPK